MIQPNELRIGNIVLAPKMYVGNCQTEECNEMVFYRVVFVSSVFSNRFEPVELTPDILEAAGFDSENYMFIKDVFDSRISICYDYGDRQCGVGFSQRHMFWTNCKYLHQLQNLIYCLTGEELQIDITKLNK